MFKNLSGKTKDYFVGALLGLAVSAMCAIAFYDMDIVAIWLIAPVVPMAILYERKAEERRKERLTAEFKDALSYVKNALDAGDSAENAFGAAVLPLKKLYGEGAFITLSFMEICRKTGNGIPLEKAFAEFALKTGIRDIQDFSDVFTVLKRTGGDMNLFVGREISILADKQSLNREINAVTAAKRNEFNIMCLIPLAMIFYLRLFSGEMLEGLYHKPNGIIFMTLMIFLYGGCILGGQWILKKHLG